MNLRSCLLIVLIMPVMVLLATAASCPAGGEFGKGVTGPGYDNIEREDIFVDQPGAGGFVSSTEEPVFPLEVSGLRLTSVMSGENVTHRISEFLGTDFFILDSFVSCYSGRGEEAVFWIIELSDDSEAGLLVSQMAARIQISSRFLQYATLEHEAVGTLHYTRLGGRTDPQEHHFFYCRDQFVYWVSMDSGDPLSLMEAFIDQF